MSHSDPSEKNEPHSAPGVPAAKPMILAVLMVIVVYFGLVGLGYPQKWSQAVKDADSHAASESVENSSSDAEKTPAEITDVEKTDAEKTADAENVAGAETTSDAEKTDAENVDAENAEHAEHAEHKAETPPIWMIIPFCALLLCIAILPLIPATEHWWENNSNRFYVAATLGLITLLYYAFLHPTGVDVHWPAHSFADKGVTAACGIFVSAIIGEYIPFIVLLFALFTISGGIRISGDLKASPLINSIIIGIGSLLASFVGTTGAAMLLIRLLINTNKERKYKVHTIIFFIFCVCNCGGCLLPIGDPPLFLGYLKGVSFLWTITLWKEWLFVNALAIGLFFLWDSLYFYPKESKADKSADSTNVQPLRISGLWPNLFCLLGVVLSVMFLAPGREIGGFNPWMFLREIAQLGFVVLSLALGSHEIRKLNEFNYSAIIEVAALFFGIFICMQAPLQILNTNGDVIAKKANEVGSKIGLSEPQQFFWMTGSLSSVLDNAPTYVVFFETAKATEDSKEKGFQAALDQAKKSGDQDQIETAQKNFDEFKAELADAKEKTGVPINIHLLMAISLGSVFMGAMTYIGNGPNFMVKAIAEQSGVKMPSFFGYMAYSVCLLLPLFILMTLLFLG